MYWVEYKQTNFNAHPEFHIEEKANPVVLSSKGRWQNDGDEIRCMRCFHREMQQKRKVIFEKYNASWRDVELYHDQIMQDVFEVSVCKDVFEGSACRLRIVSYKKSHF